LLFKVIQEYLGYDNLVEEGNKEVVRFKVEKFKLISEQIIPFFIKNYIQSSKSLNFSDFCRASALIKEKAHLTE
jgi:LAGLIDADG endonuclease